MAWRFEPGEELQAAFRRVSAEEISKVRSALTSPETTRDRAIHEARQAFKRLRALVRVAKPSLGADFEGENRRWRDAGRLLSVSRDTTVLLQCFDQLIADCGRELAGTEVEDLRKRLAPNGVATDGADLDDNVRQVLSLLDEAEASLGKLPWPDGKSALLRGFHRGQKRLRKNWKTARKHVEPDALHSWRKRVKDQAAQLRLLRGLMPNGLKARRNEEKETAELLGDEHDLWLLSGRLQSVSIPTELCGPRDRLIDEIERRRVTLQRQAFTKGEDFSAEKPKDFARAIGTAWDKAARRKGNGRRKHANGGATSPEQ